VVKKKRDDFRWSEIAFEDGETGKRCRPKIVIPESSPMGSEKGPSSRGPLQSDISHCEDDISVLSMDDESSFSPSLQSSKTSLNDEFNKPNKPKRRGSIGRLAQRMGIGMSINSRSVKDPLDDFTVSSSQSSSYRSIGDDNDDKHNTSDCFPPSIVKATAAGITVNRYQYMSKQRLNPIQKYVGFKEFVKKHQQSEERRGVINSALYTCMETDDDEEDLLSTILLSSENYLRNTPANCAA